MAGSLSYASPSVAVRSAAEAASAQPQQQSSSSTPSLNKYTYVAPSAASSLPSILPSQAAVEPVSASLTAPTTSAGAIAKVLAPKAERSTVVTLAAPSITIPAAGTSTVMDGSVRAGATTVADGSVRAPAALGLSRTFTRTYAPVSVASAPVTVTSAAAPPVVMMPGSVTTGVGAGLGVTMRAGSLQAPVGGSLQAAYFGGSLQAPARTSLATSMARPPPSRPVPPQRTTESMPDPMAIEQQKATYASSLDMQLQQGTKMLEQQNEMQRQALRQQADEQIRAFVAQVDEELRAQEMNVDQQASLQLIELQQAAHEQRALLEQQANAAVLEYEQKRVQDELTVRQYECQRRAQERQNEIQAEVARQREALAAQAREAAVRRETGVGWAPAATPALTAACGHTSSLGAFGQDVRDVVPTYATSEPIVTFPSPLSLAGARGASSYVAPRAASAASGLGGTYAACMFTG